MAGGGIGGILTVRVLQRLLELNPNYIKNTDFFAGTSTGGLIALCLAMGKGLDEIYDLYDKNGPIIFDPTTLGARGIICSRYDNTKYKALLDKVFGKTKIGDLGKFVLIPTFDCYGDGNPRRWKAKFFTNWNSNDPDNNEYLVDVAIRTSAAPTYFPSYGTYIDGGVVVNNPSMCAISQVLSNITDDDERTDTLNKIRLLSIGTGAMANHIDDVNTNHGIRWLPDLISILLDGIVDVPDYQTKTLLGGRYLRINPIVEKLPDIDDWRNRQDYVKVADDIDMIPNVKWLNNNW